MIVLGIDTSSRVVGVALCVNGDAVASRRVEAMPAETLLGLVDEVLADAGLDKRAVELVAVGKGPGLFTATRVGVATAKGIALALGRPLVGVGSLEAVMHAAGAEAVLVDAGRNEVYAASLGEAPFLASPDDALARLSGRRVVVSASLGRTMYLDAPAPDPVWIARLGQARRAAGVEDELVTLEPEYVRPSDATLPRTPLRTG